MNGEKLSPILFGNMKKSQIEAHPNNPIVDKFRDVVHTKTSYEVYKGYLEQRDREEKTKNGV